MRSALSDLLEISLRFSSPVDPEAVDALALALAAHASFQAFGWVTPRAPHGWAISAAAGGADALERATELLVGERGASSLPAELLAPLADGSGRWALFVEVSAERGAVRAPHLAVVCASEAQCRALPRELLARFAHALAPALERGAEVAAGRRATRILEGSGAAMIAWGDDGRIRELNGAAERLVGAERGALLGEHVSSLLGAVPEPTRETVRSRLRRRAGGELVVGVTVGGVSDDPELVAHALLHDLTDVDVAEQDATERLELLRELTEQHMVLLDNAPLLIFRIDPATGELLYLNRYVEAMLGVSAAQALATPGFLRELHVDPSGPEDFEQAVATARAGEIGGPYETRLALGTREPIVGRCTIYPIRGDGDRVVGIEGILLDVTHERAARSRLLESDRLATIGVLAAGVAHEINNPAAFMLLGLDLLSRNLLSAEVQLSPKVEPVIRQLVTDLKETGRRIVAIARDMRTFASPSPAAPARRQLVDVNRAVESALTLARGPISERADLLVELGEDLPMVGLDEGRLAQVVVNLLVNASHAIADARIVRGALPEGDKVRIATRSADGAVEIAVEDTGVGLAPELLERVFLPFFTTRESNGGSGLGLAIIKAIVDGARGTIVAESPSGLATPPCGARFVVRLPAELQGSREGAATRSA